MLPQIPMKNPMPERDRELLAAGLVFGHLLADDIMGACHIHGV
jgi:hypothetical protein